MRKPTATTTTQAGYVAAMFEVQSVPWCGRSGTPDQGWYKMYGLKHGMSRHRFTDCDTHVGWLRQLEGNEGTQTTLGTTLWMAGDRDP